MIKNLIILACAVVLVTSCQSVRISSDFDKTAGFDTYKTYAFTPEAQALPLDDINRGRILSAIETELAAKGFTKSEKPDVLINVNIKAEVQQTATVTSSGYGYGPGYRYGYGGGYGTAYVDYNTYTDGTLFIDMIDASKNQLVWQGRGTKTVNPDASQQKREQNINYAVKQIFMKYPPRF